MAGTVILGGFEGELVTFEMDYDDNFDVISFKCRNGSPDNKAYGVLQKVVDGEPVDTQFGLIGEPNQTTTISLPQGQNGIRLAASTKPGRFAGYSADLRFPY